MKNLKIILFVAGLVVGFFFMPSFINGLIAS